MSGQKVYHTVRGRREEIKSKKVSIYGIHGEREKRSADRYAERDTGTDTKAGVDMTRQHKYL